MLPSRWIRVGVVAVLLGSLGWSTAQARVWKAAGTNLMLEGELVDFTDNQAHIKLDTGMVFKVPIDRLSEEDQAYVRSMAKNFPSAKGDSKDEKKPGKTDAKMKADAPADAGAPAATPAEPKPETAVAAASAPPAASSSDVKVSAVGLLLAKPLPGSDSAAQEPVSGAWSADGNKLTLLISSGSGAVVGIDADKTELTSCTDDAGTNLADRAAFDNFRAAGNGQGALLDLHKFNLPAAAATKILLKGQLHVQIASGESSGEHAGLTITKGARIKNGPAPLRIDKIERVKTGPHKAVIAIASTKPLDMIREFVFVTQAGKEIPAETIGSTTYEAGKQTIYQRSIGLAESLDRGTVRILSYEKTETLVVPFELSIGLGL